MTNRFGKLFTVLGIGALISAAPACAGSADDAYNPASEDDNALAASTTVAFQNGVSPKSSYAGASDTNLAENAPTTSAGSDPTVHADSDYPDATGKTVEGLLRFDVSSVPAGSTITAVSLTVNVTNRTSGAGFSLYPLSRAWSESSATWNASASGSAWSTPGARGAADRSSTAVGVVAPTVTGKTTIKLNAAGIAAVTAWVAKPASNFGLVLDNESMSDGLVFDSSNATIAANRPRLAITYTPPAAAPVDPNAPYGAYGSYKPTASTSGVRAGTKLIPYTNQFGEIVNGALTLTTPKVKISGYDIPAFIVVKADGITIENSRVRGPASIPATGSRNLITAYDSKATNLVVQDCTLVPDVPDHNSQGIQGKSFIAQRNNIYNVVDGIDPLNSNVTILVNYIHDLAWFAPDSNHKDNHSHNDCIQFEGGGAMVVRYNNLEGFLSPSVGQGPTRPYDQANSVMLMVANTDPPTTDLEISHNWIDGGAVAINIGVGSYTNLGAIHDNVFGDNQFYKGTTILLNNARANIGLTLNNNTYGAIDRPLAKPALKGTILAVGNGIHGG